MSVLRKVNRVTQGLRSVIAWSKVSVIMMSTGDN
jgi:hypothetical protein